MRKKILSISIILLFIGVAVAPSINQSVVTASQEDDLVEVTSQACGIQGYRDTTVKLTRSQYNDLEQYLVDFRARLNQTTTREEAIPIFKEAVVELNKYGLFPIGMTVQRAQRLVTGCFSKSDLLQPFQSNNENKTGNTNCLVIGFANETFFRPYPTILDIPIISYLMFNTSFGEYFNFLLWFYVIRAYQPFKFGPFTTVGYKFRLVENGNITQEIMDTSSGWVWSLGLNGIRKWNGALYGGLNTRYRKIIFDNESYIENWYPVGIKGFVGINFFSLRTLWNGNKLPTFFIGFAREVNFTYSPPWS